MLSQENNRRGLSLLQYNERPIDLSRYNPNLNNTSLERDNRFKGYPVGNFEKSRVPLQGSVTDVENATPRKENFHLPNWLNPNSRLPGIERGQGFIYGSHDERRTISEPSVRTTYNKDQASADLRRFRELEAEANYNIQLFKEEKKRKENTREEEKKKDLEMLQNYHPWGKPGGGAPSDDKRKKTFTEEDLDKKGMLQEGENTKQIKEEFGDFGSYFGRPGHGAPLRTGSGALKTQLKGDVDIRFQNSEKGKRVNDMEVRYKQPGERTQEYSKELDRQLQEKDLKAQEERIQNLRRDIETLKYDPFGKPGAGAPNRSKSGSKLLTPRSQILTNSIEEMRRHENRNWGVNTDTEVDTAREKRITKLFEADNSPYDPWGKGVGVPRRDSHGNIERYKGSDPISGVQSQEYVTGTGLNIESHRGGAGAPIRDEDGNTSTRKVTNFSRDSWGDAIIKEPEPLHLTDDPARAIHHPFGRPGAGAPLRDSDGNVQAVISGRVGKDVTNQVSSAEQRSRQAKQLYLYDLQNDAEQQRYNRAIQDRNLKYGGGEFAAVIRDGKVGHPKRDPNTGFLTNHHLGTTDVTRMKTDERKFKGSESNNYHTELQREAEERKQMKLLERLKEKQEETWHLKALDNMYGKPGGGAPLPGGTRRPNFDNILHSPRRQPEGFYAKQIENGNIPNAYVKSTINSNHKNLFQSEIPVGGHQGIKNYRVPIPYATQEETSLDKLFRRK